MLAPSFQNLCFYNMNASKIQVLPPANGKKLWRVKRSVLTSNPASLDANLSLECMKNSMKISAAGNQFMSKRPPLKRPKAKPGMPKDFVFVDLLPVKSEELESDSIFSTTSPSMGFCGQQSPSSTSTESFTSYEDDSYQNIPLDYLQPIYDDVLLGMELMPMPSECQQVSLAELAMQMQRDQLAFQRFLQMQCQFMQAMTQAQAHVTQTSMTQTPVMSNVPMTPFAGHRRSMSVTAPRRKSTGGFQFKTYNGPNSIKKPTRKHTRSFLEPTVKLAAASKDMDLNDIMRVPKEMLNLEHFDLSYTPLSDIDLEGMDALQMPMDLDILHNCDTTQFFKDEFDLSTFVSI